MDKAVDKILIDVPGLVDKDEFDKAVNAVYSYRPERELPQAEFKATEVKPTEVEPVEVEPVEVKWSINAEDMEVPADLFGKIIYSDSHGHALVLMSDKDAFITAGWLFVGTLSEDAAMVPLARVRRP